jgi:ATP-binding cassette subfamily C protein CydD
MLLHPRAIAILDEPTANLDATTTGIILEEIERLAQNTLVIVASHEDKFDSIATKTLHLNWGEQMIINPFTSTKN